jgi:hypothetical protein
MNIPGFNAEVSLTSPWSVRYRSRVASGATGTVVPQATNLGGFEDVIAGCIVRCIQRAGGSDPVAILQQCEGVCRLTGGGIVFWA